jgi:hypothetical protein
VANPTKRRSDEALPRLGLISTSFLFQNLMRTNSLHAIVFPLISLTGAKAMNECRGKGFSLAAFFLAVSGLIAEVKRGDITIKEMSNICANARQMSRKMANDFPNDPEPFEHAQRLLEVAETLFAAAAAEASSAGSH